MQIFTSSKHFADYYNFRFKQTMLTTQVSWHDNKQSQVRKRDGMLGVSILNTMMDSKITLKKLGKT